MTSYITPQRDGADKKRLFTVVVLGIESIYRYPTCCTGVMLLIEIEKSMIFAELKLPGIATLIRTFS